MYDSFHRIRFTAWLPIILSFHVGAAFGDETPIPFRPETRVSISRTIWRINGRPTCVGTAAEGLLMNVRMVNAVFEDAKRPAFDPAKNTAAFIARIPEYATAVRAFSICLQGGMSGYEGAVNSAFNPDGSLRESYMRRVADVIEACDCNGCVVILGCFYQRQDQILEDFRAVRAGVRNVANWLQNRRYSNVVLEIANEFGHPGFDHQLLKTFKGQVELITLAKETHPKLLVGTSGLGDGKLPDDVCRASDFLLIHLNSTPVERIPSLIAALRKHGKPIVCNEDAKLGVEGSRSLGMCVAHGASWGFMYEKRNQHFPFRYSGANDDPIVYARLRTLTSPYAFPRREWFRVEPDAAGLDVKTLDTFARAIGGRGCVVRRGYLVYSWGDAQTPGDVASAAKPVYAHFLWKALHVGLIANLDDTVVRDEPGLQRLNASLGFKDRAITWRHLLTQTSCYGVVEPPGKAFDYNDFQMALFWDLLFGKVYGVPAAAVDRELLQKELAKTLQFQDNVTMLRPGLPTGRLVISPRDFARFGLLYLREGNWGKYTQLFPAELARKAVSSPLSNEIPRTSGKRAEMLPGQRSIGGGNNQTDHLGSYSFLWWTNGVDRNGKRHWPSLPLDAYAALGHNGMRGLLIVPSLDLIVSWNDSLIDGREAQDRILGIAAKAVRTAPGIP